MKKIFSIFLALAMILALAACTKEAAEPVDYTGTYDIIKIEAGEMSASEEDLQALQDLGYEAVMSFASDGTGLMSVAGQENDFTYDAENATINMDGADSKMEFNEEGQLVIYDDGGTMYLEKRTQE
ncbi:MAG: hypothetical protein IKH87_10155 [Firmicutes bacterium]|nr:hypothetical protein [Bacillota bacterium]MBR3034970.1 hypothetical protein [Bacillota bacterium]MBR4142508.1 hypothetical protein [Bacillota bacterium]MBR6971068.1 hypothetical protein [Bacillota bacterium]